MNRNALVKASRKFAQDKAKELRERYGTNKKFLANALYDKLDIKYGIFEAVSTGNFGPFPFEIKEQTICFTFAVYQYFIAEALFLKPEMYFGYGLNYSRKGESNTISYDHAFIDVDIGMKHRLLIDRHMSMYGYVRYSDGFFRVKDNYTTKYCKCRYNFLKKQSFCAMIDALMYLKTPQGALGLLEQGQKISTDCMCRFNQQNRILELHHIVTIPIAANSLFIEKHQFNLRGDIKQSTLEFYKYSHQDGWMQYNQFLHLCTLKMEFVHKFFEILKQFPNARKKDSKKIADTLIQEKKYQKVILKLQNILELDAANVNLKKHLAIQVLYLQKRKKKYLFTQKKRNQHLERMIKSYVYEYFQYLKLQYKDLTRSISAKRYITAKNYAMRDAVQKIVSLKNEIDTLRRFKIKNKMWYNEITDILCFQNKLAHYIPDQPRENLFRVYCEIMIHQLVLASQHIHREKYSSKLTKMIRKYYNRRQ